MLAIKRKELIKESLLEKKSVTVSELSTLLQVTEETVRKDLQLLERENFLTRTHGGAFIQSGVINQISASIRENAYVDNKMQIGNCCSQLIQNGDSIFLDSSTTAYHVAASVKNKRLTIITNSLLIANYLSSFSNINLVLIGGRFDANNKSFIGAQTVSVLNEYFVDKAFFSCRSLSIEHGITDSNEDYALIRKTAISRADKAFLIVDHTKFDRTSFIKICNYDKVNTLVTDLPLSDAWRESLQQANILIVDQPSK